MNKAILLSIALIAALLVGCGSDNEQEMEKLRGEQERAVQKMNEAVRTLSMAVGRMREDVNGIEGELAQLRGLLDDQLMVALAAGPGAPGAKRTRSKTAATAGTDTDVHATTETGTAEAAAALDPVEMDLETLSAELTKMQENFEKLNTQYETDKELTELRDPRKTWEAMGNSEQFAARLDRLTTAHAPTIEDEAAREQLLTDAAAIKEQVNALAQLSTDDQVYYFSQQLTQRINDPETNDRMRQWYDRQLNTLTTGDQEAVATTLEHGVRFDNARQVGQLATKYSISSQTLRDNGLQTFGRGMGSGRRGGGHRGR